MPADRGRQLTLRSFHHRVVKHKWIGFLHLVYMSLHAKLKDTIFSAG